jgi:GTP-binding protein
VRLAVKEADHVIFVVDGRSELTRNDRELADYLRRSGRPITIAVNKCDTDRGDEMASAFYELSLGEPIPISAEHDRGVAELLEKATAEFPAVEDEAESEERLIRVAIIGRPNVGKSTLLNRLTGGEHSMVSPTAGTTRDAVDVTIERDGVRFEFVDTAGIRRKGKTKEMAEKLSVMMAQRHVRLANVVIMMLDAVEGVTALDANIAGYAHEGGRGVILVVNKWDQLSGVEQGAFERRRSETS